MVDRVVEIKDGIISENFENVNKITAKDLENL